MAKVFRVKHIFCGMERVITGNDFYHACRLYDLDYDCWTVLEMWKENY